MGEHLVGRLDTQRHRTDPNAVGRQKNQQRLAAAIGQNAHALALGQALRRKTRRKLVAATFQLGVGHGLVAQCATALYGFEFADGRLFGIRCEAMVD